MLSGRGLRTGAALLFTPMPELVVDVDMALPGREADKLFGVISPDRRPRGRNYRLAGENFKLLKIMLV